jgi:multiple antibiotic resistance protein
MHILSVAITLFLVMDPIGNIPFFLSTLRAVPEERRQKVLIRELLIAYVALVLFLIAGPRFIEILHLRPQSISIAGGIILFLISLRMVFPMDILKRDELEGEPLVVPLAIPGVAGPSALATLLLMTSSEPDRIWQLFLALTGTWLVSAAVLMASPLFYRILRERGLVAMERLMGMILVALAVQMFLDGLAKQFFAQGVQ